MTLRTIGLSKRFDRAVLQDVDLDLGEEGYACIMGPSGCGKTTLLRIVAGLEVQDAGRVLLDDRPLDALPPEQRPVRMVFQHGALFPHLDVAGNVGFALALVGRSAADIRTEVHALLDAVGLPASWAERAIDTLSGGERQRIALARALAGDPRVLLLDEPLTAIDRPLRADLRERLRELQRSRGRLFVHVTHDPHEALALADRLVVLDAGRVLAHGEAEPLYRRPPDLVTARLLGELGPVPANGGGAWLRPERLRIATDGARARATGRIVERILHGASVELAIDCAGTRCRLRAIEAHGSVGDDVGLWWSDDDVLRLPERP